MYIVYFRCYCSTSTGKYQAGRIQCWSQIPEGHMCPRSLDMAKMDPSAADMASAQWNGYVQDARRHASGTSYAYETHIIAIMENLLDEASLTCMSPVASYT